MSNQRKHSKLPRSDSIHEIPTQENKGNHQNGPKNRGPRKVTRSQITFKELRAQKMSKTKPFNSHRANEAEDVEMRPAPRYRWEVGTCPMDSKDMEQMIESEFLCGICHDILYKATTLKCGHMFCHECIRMWCQMKRATCPVCRKSATSQNLAIPVDSFINRMADAIGGHFKKRREEQISTHGVHLNANDRQNESKSYCINVILSDRSTIHLNIDSGDSDEDEYDEIASELDLSSDSAFEDTISTDGTFMSYLTDEDIDDDDDDNDDDDDDEDEDIDIDTDDIEDDIDLLIGSSFVFNGH